MIVDFYCPAVKLITELDCADHYTVGGAEDDPKRDHRLKYLGFRVLRFENEELFRNVDAILEDIRIAFQQ